MQFNAFLYINDALISTICIHRIYNKNIKNIFSFITLSTIDAYKNRLVSNELDSPKLGSEDDFIFEHFLC